MAPRARLHRLSATERSETDGRALTDDEVSAIIGILAVLAGEILGAPEANRDLIERLHSRMIRDGLLPSASTARDVHDALERVIARVRQHRGEQF